MRARRAHCADCRKPKLKLIRQQNASRDSWRFETTEKRLPEIMHGIHDLCAQSADACGAPGNYVLGANIAGFMRVAEAVRALGVI